VINSNKDVIRATLKFNGLCNSIAIELCTTILQLQTNQICEVWVKCNKAEELILYVEKALNKGLLLLEVGFTTGHKIKGYALNLKDVFSHGTNYIEVNGEIEFEYYTPLQNWIKNLQTKKLKIDLQKHRAQAHLTKPITTAQLFDTRIRLLKPQKIPP